MTVSSSTSRVSYNGNGSTTVFAYTFKVLDQDDLTVIVRSSNGTETVQTITTHYTVSGVGSDSGGNVTMVTAPASGETITILREQPLTQGLDLVPNDPFPAETLEEALDKLTFMVQTIDEEVGRSLKASRTNTISTTEFTVSASDRANKVFAFDSSGDIAVTQEIGTFTGNWAASTAYQERDIIKDTSNNNIYICVTAHTSSGSQPISSNADSAKWELLVDAASATTSATNAAASATAAASSATAAASSATAAAASESAAASSASAASTSETNAASSATNASNSATAAAASETAAAASETAAAASETAAAASESAAATSATNAATSETNAASSASTASTAATTATTQATAAAASATAAAASELAAATSETNAATSEANAAASYDLFDDRFLGAKSSAPTLDNDGDALVAGALYFDTTAGAMYVWNGSAWQSTEYNSTNVDINGGSIDGTPIGANSASTGAFTSATVSGDLTVDTNTLYVDSTNNYIGLFQASPAHPLHVGTSDLILDSSGNLLVGTTDTNPQSSSTETGLSLRGGIGFLGVSRSSDPCAAFNRLSTDGNVVDFRKDGTTVGSIGTVSGVDMFALTSSKRYLQFSAGTVGDVILIDGQLRLVRPNDDNLTDLGSSSWRFDDIYATNGTIQTSDLNEKQDIAELDEAEKRVAVACKGLIRKYRWKDAVAEKGDAARIHVGIIAQDLQDAFAAEGLDSHDYAMFISATWWEHDGQTYETAEEAPEGAVEKTRLGVRYPELLAFIIGAL